MTPDTAHSVRIFRPSRNTMQSGRGKLKHWVLEY